VFSILFLLYVLQVGSLIIWFTDTGQSLSAEVWSAMSYRDSQFLTVAACASCIFGVIVILIFEANILLSI